MENPKMVGSGLVECKPQVGKCENDCNQCYYNRNEEYKSVVILPKDTGKIVRMNAGHDSNIRRGLVLAAATRYEHVFFNTSIPRFDFPGPVVFTANSEEELAASLIDIPENLMFVRLRVSSTNLDFINEAIRYYTGKLVPVVLTYMAYYTARPYNPGSYTWKKRFVNSYWCPTEVFKRNVLLEYGNRLVRNCGTLCKDCGNCETFYRLMKCG